MKEKMSVMRRKEALLILLLLGMVGLHGCGETSFSREDGFGEKQETLVQGTENQVEADGLETKREQAATDMPGAEAGTAGALVHESSMALQ